jgi:hypothetical protein
VVMGALNIAKRGLDKSRRLLKIQHS